MALPCQGHQDKNYGDGSMELNDKVTQLEDEIKILKNEVQAVLLDLRESFLNNINPFNPTPILTQAAAPVTVIAPDSPVERPPDIENKQPLPEIFTDENKPENMVINDLKEQIPSFTANDELPTNDFSIEDLFEDNTPSFVANPGAGREKSPDIKEEKMVWHPETKVETHYIQKEAAITIDTNNLNLETIDKLSRWVESSVDRLGPQRTKTILDITETMGYVNSDLINILVKFIHPSEENKNINASTRDYLAVLVELNKLLMGDNKMEIAMLFFLILFQEYDNR